MFKSLILCLIIIIICNSFENKSQLKLSKATNDFGLRLLQHLYKDQTNVFFSPLSISIAFGMLYTGARGLTAEEIKQCLGYYLSKLDDKQINEEFSYILRAINANKSNNKYELSVANRIIAQKKFQIIDSFNENLKNYFNSSIELMDFSQNAAEIKQNINEWVSKQTNNKIKEILSQPLDPMTRMVILNAIYFKGKFQTMFDRNNTREEVFLNNGVEEKRTQTMKRIGFFNYTDIQEIDCKLLEIPYSGDDISLYILLPNQKQGYRQLIDNLKDVTIIEESIDRLQKLEVSVSLPKFKIETSYVLNKQLTQLGMKSVFTRDADLSGINGHYNLYVSQVIHKSYVEVNEEGTEASSATAIKVMLRSMFPKRKEFRADHPFIFFIRNNRLGVDLFYGLINSL